MGPSQGRYLHTQHEQNKRTQTSMPLVGFEPTISVFERGKEVYALDRVATVSGERELCHWKSLSITDGNKDNVAQSACLMHSAVLV
jgi:hypothetical protein